MVSLRFFPGALCHSRTVGVCFYRGVGRHDHDPAAFALDPTGPEFPHDQADSIGLAACLWAGDLW